MEQKYESILVEAMDAVAGKLEQAQARWEKSCEMVQLKNIAKLREFGLPNLQLWAENRDFRTRTPSRERGHDF